MILILTKAIKEVRYEKIKGLEANERKLLDFKKLVGANTDVVAGKDWMSGEVASVIMNAKHANTRVAAWP